MTVTLKVIAFILFLIVPADRISFAADLAVVADRKFENTVTALRESLDFVVLRGKELQRELCRYPRLLILGPESYLRTKDLSCPGQKRYIGGVLYPDLLGLPEGVRLISPLPCCKLLSPFGSAWLVISSGSLDYYLRYLRRCFSIREFRVKTPYELAQIMPKLRQALREGFGLLLLPDPVLVRKKARLFLRELLSREDPKGIDLVGIPQSPLPSPPFVPEEYARTIVEALTKDTSVYYGGLR